MKNNVSIKKAKISVIILFLSLFSLLSCDKTNPLSTAGCSENWANLTAKEYNAYLDAVAKFGNDPTPANCENYKKALLKYISSYQKIKKCVPSASLSNYNSSLKKLKAEINDIDCNG